MELAKPPKSSLAKRSTGIDAVALAVDLAVGLVAGGEAAVDAKEKSSPFEFPADVVFRF